MRELLLDAAGFAGVGSIGAGCWQIYPPSALIVVGAALVILAVMGARAHGPTGQHLRKD